MDIVQFLGYTLLSLDVVFGWILFIIISVLLVGSFFVGIWTLIVYLINTIKGTKKDEEPSDIVFYQEKGCNMKEVMRFFCAQLTFAAWIYSAGKLAEFISIPLVSHIILIVGLIGGGWCALEINADRD